MSSNNDPTTSRRHLALLLFTGNAILYAMRVNLSVAIVAMVGVRKRKDAAPSPADLEDTCPMLETPVILQVSSCIIYHVA